MGTSGDTVGAYAGAVNEDAGRLMENGGAQR